MSPQRKPRTLMDRISDVGLWLIVGSAVLGGFKDRGQVWRTTSLVMQEIGTACLLAWIIWLFARRKEFERLVFYQSSVFAFCSMLVFGFVWAILEDADVAHRVSASTYVSIAALSWFAAMMFLRWRAR